MTLRRLRLAEYALIDEVEVEFGPGLNVLTGETGAGKSILVEGVALLLGARASTDAIREGAERAVVEGLFGDARGGERLVRREIRRDRSNRCYLDGDMATARMLREVGERRVVLHGQHEDRLLVKGAVQRKLLDAFAGAEGIAETVSGAAEALAALEAERAELEDAERRRAERIDYLRSQVEEIDAAEIEPGEEESLASEAERLRHSTERRRLAGELNRALAEADDAVAPALAGLERHLRRLAELDADLAPLADRLTSVRYDLEEVGRELGRYADAVDLDPGRLAAVEERRDLLFRLRRKHGGSLEEVLETARRMREELSELEAAERRAASLDAEREEHFRELTVATNALADAREAAADRLEAAVTDRLAELGMGEGTFEIDLSRRPDPGGVPRGGERWAWSRAGLERVEFRIAPNAGESPRPLSRIASGGELSRVMLALQSALAAADRTPTLVFDEIDAGIGGRIAHRVAAQLKAVAKHHQVIVVTHLAQIAAAADRHLVVEKAPRDERTVISARSVDDEDRVREVSRLLGGDPDRDVSRHHAEELLTGRA
ncbi:MAG: DNA repair protein RecN [Gemmatimonadota bacterium]|nr:DNA repair protein RecN [Gemmatimonadota bacterium]